MCLDNNTGMGTTIRKGHNFFGTEVFVAKKERYFLERHIFVAHLSKQKFFVVKNIVFGTNLFSISKNQVPYLSGRITKSVPKENFLGQIFWHPKKKKGPQNSNFL